MKRAIGLMAGLMSMLFVRGGLAQDSLHGSRFEPSEVRHRMRIVVGRGSATLKIERTLFNPGDRPDQALLAISLPPGGVATGLATLGVLDGRPHWFLGELKEAEEAARTYQELTGVGGYYPKDPALLSWRSQEQLMLQVFPCMPKQEKTVSYTIALPLDYGEGRYRFNLPRLGLEERAAQYTLESGNGSDVLFRNGERVPPGRVFRLAEETEIALEPTRPPAVDGELAVAATGLGRSYMHARFALAKQLSAVPSQAYLVFGIDNSHSMLERRGAAVALAKATLSHFRDARVQILDYNRLPHPRFPGFWAQASAMRALEQELAGKTAIRSGNGSEIDLALVEAQRQLRMVPRGHEKRVLFFTDALAPARIDARSVEASVGRNDAIVHIVEVESGPELSLSRDDEHVWASAARLSFGLAWQATYHEESASDLATACLSLARPTSLDHVVYSDSDSKDDDEEFDTLAEGSGVERQGLFERELRWVRLTGELWSKPFRMTLQPDPAASRLWSALVFGTDYLDQLSEPEMMVLAQRGKAVSPVTSYLAVEPGVRPSTEGLDWGDGTGVGIGLGGLGLSGIGEGGGGRGDGLSVPFDREAFLRGELRKVTKECGANGKITVRLETHFSEIADVTLRLDEQDPSKFACIERAVWEIDLSGRDYPDRRRNWEIEI